MTSPLVFSTQSYAYLRDDLGRAAGLDLGSIELATFPDGERYQRVEVPVSGRDVVLIGGTVSIEVDRHSVSELLVDGFFPRCESTDRPAPNRVSGFSEIGLPFESDTAIPRHVAHAETPRPQSRFSESSGSRLAVAPVATISAFALYVSPFMDIMEKGVLERSTSVTSSVTIRVP